MEETVYEYKGIAVHVDSEGVALYERLSLEENAEVRAWRFRTRQAAEDFLDINPIDEYWLSLQLLYMYFEGVLPVMTEDDEEPAEAVSTT